MRERLGKRKMHGRHDGFLHGFSQLSLGYLLHLGKNHSGDFLWGEGLFLTKIGNLDEGRSIFVNDFERPVSHVLCYVSCGQSAVARVLRWTNLFDIGITGKVGRKERVNDSVDGKRGFVSTHSNLRPINRLASKTVFRGFMAAWFLAASPIRRSSEEKAT